MNYYLIGSGAMATFLAARLSAGGHTCSGLWARNRDAAADLARAAGLPLLSAPADLLDGADCCILAVADDAVSAVAASLRFRQTVLIHAAGSVPMAALHPGAAEVGVAWPVISLAGSGPPPHLDFPVLWEASSRRAARTVRAVAEALGVTTIHEADSPTRAALHSAAVFAQNFSNHMMAVAEMLCTDAALPFPLLHPLMRQTWERVSTMSPRMAQSGPARRGDTLVLQAQSDALKSRPEIQQVYEAVSRSIMQMYGIG